MARRIVIENGRVVSSGGWLRAVLILIFIGIFVRVLPFLLLVVAAYILFKMVKWLKESNVDRG